MVSFPFLDPLYLDKKLNNLCFRCGSEFAKSPLFVYIVVNRACNLKCKMCDMGCEQKDSNLYGNLKSGEHDMDFTSLKRTINQFRGRSERIIFNSTEPLLYPDIIEAVKHVKQNKLVCKIATNGFLLPELAEDLYKAGLDILTISLDGPEEVHDKIRGAKGSHRKIIEGIEKLNELKGKREKPFIRINTTISEHNYGRIAEIVRELQCLRISKFNFSHLNVVTAKMKEEHNKTVPWYPTGIKSSLSPKKINTGILYSQLEEIRTNYSHLNIGELPYFNKHQLEVYYKQPEQKLFENNKCYFPWTITQILANGDVVPIMRCMNIVLGNVFKTSFKDIWNGKEYRLLRKRLNQYKSFPACRRCCGIFGYP